MSLWQPTEELHIALCGLGCFADAMTTRLDRMMQVARKPSSKRVCADSTVSVQDVQACITRHLRDRSAADLWSCIVPGPDGPRAWSFKSRPDGRWMARFSSLAFDLVCDVCKNTKILSRVLVAALQACVLAGVVNNTSGSEETEFIASVDVTVRILLSWFRQVKVSKKIRDAALKRVSEAENAKVSAVMEKIELNADEAEAAAKESEDGSESDVDMTFLVSLDSLCSPSSTPSKTTMAEKEGAKDKTSLEKFETDNAALHLMFDKVIRSTSSAAPSGSAPEGSVPGGSAPGGSARSGSAPSSSAAAEQGQLRDFDLLALARSRRPAFVDTKVASGSKPKAKAKAKAKAKPKAKAVAKTKAQSMAAQKKRPAAAAEANTAPDAAEYTFMTYDKGKPTERIAICEWCGAKRVGQILQVAGKGLAEKARAAIAQELMDMLVAGTPLVVKARKLELLSAAV